MICGIIESSQEVLSQRKQIFISNRFGGAGYILIRLF